MDMQQYIDIAKSDDREYEFYGIRHHHGGPVAVGETLACSWVWDDGQPTDIELDGTCAVDLTDDNATTAMKQYAHFGEPIVIAGFRASWGDEPGEIIIKDAIRVA